MANDDLLPSQKNQIYQLIEKIELNPNNFEWLECEEYVSEFPNIVSKILYKGTNFYFIFNTAKVEFSPGSETARASYKAPSWEAKYNAFFLWLKCLKGEINQPDLWAELKKQKLPDGTKIDPEASNEPFAYHEVEKILAGIEQVKAYIEQHVETDEAQKKVVNDKLDYLAGAAKRQGRKDWIHTCIGVMMTLGVALALSPIHADAIWKFIEYAVSGLVQFLPGNIQK